MYKCCKPGRGGKSIKNANKDGITCITISQRLALEEFHTQELHLGANTPNGWTLRNIKRLQNQTHK